MNCSHPTREKKWRSDLMTSLEKLCTTLETDPHLQDLLLKRINQLNASETDENYEVSYEEYLDLHIPLSQTSSKIADWERLLDDRCSKQRVKLQDRYLYQTGFSFWENNGMKKKLTGEIWTVQVLQEIWTQWQTLWKTRNEDQHDGVDTRNKAISARRETDRQVQEIYKLWS